MLALTALFVGLGVWQLERLEWKEGLIAEVAARHRRSRPYAAAAGRRLGRASTRRRSTFHPVTVTGHVAPRPARCSSSPASTDAARASYSGPGYWVMTPFALDGGGTVFVDRGFVPQASAPAFVDGDAARKAT